MKIPLCRDEVYVQCLFCAIGFTGAGALCWVCDWATPAVWGAIAIVALVLITTIHEAIYYGRSFILDESGFTIILAGYRKKYSWDKITYSNCDNRNEMLCDGEWCYPGVIISAKPINKPAHIAAMTYTRYSHPFSSVFLSYRSEATDNPPSTLKYVATGYVVEKNDIMDSLSRYKSM